MKNVADIYPLTPTQSGMLYHTLRSPGNELYFQQISCTIRGALDYDYFKRAWDQVVARHPALRTIFIWEGIDEPLQIVRQEVTVPWDLFDWRDSASDKQADRLTALQHDYRKRGFDLTQAPLLSMALIRIDDEQYHFIWNFHHLLTDGWSTHLVFNEAFAVYEKLRLGAQPNLPAVRPFQNYIAWLKQQNLESAERYWRKLLNGLASPTPLQVDKPVVSAAVSHGETSIELSQSTTTALKAMAQQHRLTLNTIVLGAWALLLSRYSGQEDVVFGTTLSGRPVDLDGVENMVGMFINTLPLRTQITDDVQLLSWLQGLQNLQLEIRQYEYSPLAQVQRWSDVSAGQALFDSIVVFENYPIEAAAERSIQLENVHYREQSNYPLALLVVPREHLELLAIFNQNRFEETAISRILGHLETILIAMASNPIQTLSEIPLLSSEEYQQIVFEWNDTEVDLGSPVWLSDRIAQAAQTAPNTMAIVAEDHNLTYAELDARANQLAHLLIKRGVIPGGPIGLYVDRSAAMIVGILGILKAGCAYVPLDPAYPSHRIRFILDDTKAQVVVAQPHLAGQINHPELEFILLDSSWSAITAELDQAPEVRMTGDDMAYIIYTSGSTGQPKGVRVTHANLFQSTAARHHFYEEIVGRFLLLSSFAFDSSVAGIFWTLADGGTLVLPAPGDERDLDQLADLIARERVTHTLALPSLYRLLLDYSPTGALESLRTVIVAGEVCPPDLSTRHFNRLPATRLYNEYGPTEATVWASVYPLRPTSSPERVPIGQPIANTQLYVLDRRREPVPVGVPGELVIGGAGIVPGYWRRPDLSRARFQPNPFGKGRVYHSGDRVRWQPNGNLEFLGRSDDQIKIRGYRVELGEIKNALVRNSAVRDALVTANNDRLVAYLISESPGKEPTDQVYEELAARLPDFMLPTAWMWIKSFPQTPNGKIDRKQLPDPQTNRTDLIDDQVAPQSETERTIAKIWGELLGFAPIGVHDDFFQLGGHSLMVTQLISRLRRTFGFAIPIRVVLDTRTIAGQAQRIDTLVWAAGEPSSNAGEREDIEI